MKKAVQISCRSFCYPSSTETVLENFEMELNYGEVALLSGLSGNGKSTVVSLINGIIPRVVEGEFDGRILIDGEDSKSMTMGEISRKVGSVLQNAEEQIIHQIVEDEIAFGCENLGFEESEIAREIDENCSVMEIEPEWKTRSLSGGQKQRLVTASTLAMKGDILVFDEPLANLDGRGAEILLNLLKKLSEAGKAVLIVEHRIDIVLPYVDSVWVLEGKRAERISDKESFLKSQTDIIPDLEENALHFSENALEISGVAKSFGKRKILCGIDLAVKRGERILFSGENGCGKSTLMSIVARLQKADMGTVVQRFDPSCGKKASRKWFSIAGVVHQNPNYQLFMPTVRDEILFGSEDAAYALSLAERFGLGPLFSRHPHSLSEGQKRRVTICSILARRPRLLLLDEPTVGQDYRALQTMMQILNEIHRTEGNTMLSVTHDVRCMSSLCDRNVRIEGGVVADIVANFFSTSENLSCAKSQK